MFLVLFVPPPTSWDFIKTSSKSQEDIVGKKSRGAEKGHKKLPQILLQNISSMSQVEHTVALGLMTKVASYSSDCFVFA